MTIKLDTSLTNYSNQTEKKAIILAVDTFTTKVIDGQNDSCFDDLDITVGADDKALYDGKQSFAVSHTEDKQIEFNIQYCLAEGIDDYLALLAHEIGHMFPQWLKINTFPMKNIKIFGDDQFVSALCPQEEYVADYYACKWGFQENIIALRMKTERNSSLKDDYIELLRYYQDKDRFHFLAFKHKNNVALRCAL